MPGVLANRTYRRLFLAQAVALAGTGLATVALALLAFELAGEDAGRVLGTALAIKMLAYIGVSLIASAFVDRLPRRAFLVAMDLLRAGIVLNIALRDRNLADLSADLPVAVGLGRVHAGLSGPDPRRAARREGTTPGRWRSTRMAYDLENLFRPPCWPRPCLAS